MRARILVVILFLLFTATGLTYAQDFFHMTLTAQDREMRLEYRYKALIFTPAWNQSNEAFETEKMVYYAKHWELDESKKYSSLEQNYLDGSTAYITEKNLCLKMLNGAHFDENGMKRESASYSHSFGRNFGHMSARIIIIDLNDGRIVWRNYDWEPF